LFQVSTPGYRELLSSIAPSMIMTTQHFPDLKLYLMLAHWNLSNKYSFLKWVFILRILPASVYMTQTTFQELETRRLSLVTIVTLFFLDTSLPFTIHLLLLLNIQSISTLTNWRGIVTALPPQQAIPVNGLVSLSHL
jgi:hypothetical protein